LLGLPNLIEFKISCEKSADVSSTVNFRSSIPGSDSSISMVLSEDVCSSILDQFIKGADGEEISGSISQTVKALMPENVFSNHPVSTQMTVPQGHQSSVLNFLNLTMFLVSNNFLGATADVSKKVYNWVKRRSNAGLLEYLLSISGPTAEALAENLFRLAINDDDVLTVKKIMELGIDPNEQICRTRYGLNLTPLQRACEMGSLELVQVLIKAGADVNSIVSNGNSALTRAAYYFNDDYNPELVQILLHAGAKANPGYGESPLSKAAGIGNVEVVALLISAGADVNFSDEGSGATPLMESVSGECVPDEDAITIVRNLLQAGADAQATAIYNTESVTVLDAAMWRSNIELIQLLLDGGARITESAFVTAVSGCRLDIAKLLLKSGARVTERVIESAAENDESEMVWFLLDSAEDSIKERGSSAALIAAIHHGKTDLIDALDVSGIQLNSTPKLTAAIGAAADRGDIRLFRLLLGDNSRYRASITESLGSSLHAAIANGRNDIIEMLLAAGADVNAKPHLQMGSPLLAAIRRKDMNLARKLLAAGAAVNENLNYPSIGLQCTTTVLPAAVAWGYLPLIRDIISAGAEVNSPEWEGRKTALTVAVERGDSVAIQLLIDAGADVNAPAATLFGRTALEAAVRNNDIDMVHYLLGIGADPDDGSLIAAVSGSVQLMQILLTARLSRYQRYPKGYGCSALQHAIRLKNAAMVEILLANGVDANAIVRPKLGDKVMSPRENASPIYYGEYGESALGTAIKTDKSNDLWIVRILLRGGADPNSIVIELVNSTALLAAINQKNLALVNVLIAAGVDANASLTVHISRTPLQLAAEKGSMDIVYVLLEHGADVNAPPYDRYGATALQFAAIGGYVGIAYLLLERGAEVNAPPAKVGGRTALEGAAEHGRIDVLQLLLNAGAQVMGPGGEQYERARELASRNGHIAARRLLESYNAQRLENFAGWDLMSTDVGILGDLQF
jgi:ankyrin repeat protein